MKLLLTLSSFLLFSISIFAQFTDVSAVTGTNFGGTKNGGVAWADFNNDGCLDIIFNTNVNTPAARTRILFSDCNLPNPTFADVTAANANGLTLNMTDRAISVGDYNNDGYIDIVRNSYLRFEVYLNNGPFSVPAFSFGDVNQGPNFVIQGANAGVINMEGFGWMDYNNDGWLDLILENHNFGIDIYENPADGSANFFYVTPNADPKGLPTGGTSGDYMTLCDYDDDGDVDILARKEDEFDLWTNTGAGTFFANPTFDEQASNANKGGVLFCDFDNDGDFDIFWTDEGDNQIFTQIGLNSGNFVATNEPTLSSGIVPVGNIDGCSCGDVDNDGDMDLFLGANFGLSYLYLNDGGMNFTRNNLGINPNGDTEGNSFGDYDNDGDLDLYLNVNGGNQLWRNGTNNTNYLKVLVRRDLGLGISRDDLGATAILKDCLGNILGGIRQVESVKGHGSNSPAVIHFGLPLGNAVEYLLEVRFTTVAGTRLILDTVITPASLVDQTITILSPLPENSFMDGCAPIVLPIELINFEASLDQRGVNLEWSTASEKNNDYFTLMRSKDGVSWEEFQEIDGAGNSASIINYKSYDFSPYDGISYYRLKQTDFDGQYSYSKIVSVNNKVGVTVYPNPTNGILFIRGSQVDENQYTIFNAIGKNVTGLVNIEYSKNDKLTTIDLSHLKSGVYIIKTMEERYKVFKR